MKQWERQTAILIPNTKAVATQEHFTPTGERVFGLRFTPDSLWVSSDNDGKALDIEAVYGKQVVLGDVPTDSFWIIYKTLES